MIPDNDDDDYDVAENLEFQVRHFFSSDTYECASAVPEHTIPFKYET